MSRLIFDNIPDAKRLLELRREELAGYIMEHLQALGGNPLKEQYSHPDNLAISIVGRYPQSARDNIHKAIFSTCKWLTKNDYLTETNNQGFYEISERGNLVKLATDIAIPGALVAERAGAPNVPRSEASALDKSLIEKPKIFISYCWKDKSLVLALEDDLSAAGAEVWIDHRGIRGGDNLPDEISNALRWCDTLLLIWSNASVDSYWVKLEWTNALSLKKKIIPCLVDRTELPPILSHKAYVDMSDVKTGVSQLLRTLQCSNQPNEATPRLRRHNRDYHRAKRWLSHLFTNTRALIVISTIVLLALVIVLGTQWIRGKQERTPSAFQQESIRLNQFPGSVQPSEPSEVDFTLHPGSLRSGDGERAVIPSFASARTLRLHLVLFANKYQSYQGNLLTADGRIRAAMSDLPADIQDSGKAVIMRLPAQGLTAGDYRVALSGTINGVPHEVADYYFRVSDK